MSQEQHHSATTNQCQICHERSAWDFLRDFYQREDAAREYILRLESDLCLATTAVEETRLAFTNCEAALFASWEKLNNERLDHRASREELSFERERHQESIELLDRVFKEAVRSGDVADSLRSQVTVLQAALDKKVSREAWNIKGSPIEPSSPSQSSTLHKVVTSINQQSELPKRSATEPPDINASREPEIKHSISLFGPPLPTTESQTKISGNIMTSKGVTKGRRNGKAVSAKGKQ